MARPTKDESERRTSQIMLTLTLEEADRLKKRAELAREPVAVFTRRAALQSRVTVKRGRGLDPDAFAELNRIGVNLNQIAKAANRGRAPYADELETLLERINTILDEGID